MAARYRRRPLCGRKVQDKPAMWQQGAEEGPCGSRVQEEAAMWQQGIGGGCYVAARYNKRLLCGDRVQEEGTGGGCHVAARYRRRLLCGSKV